MGRILEFSRHVGIPVVDDVAQATGTVYRDGRSAGSIGVMGCLSFYPTRNLGGIGDGGMVVTVDEALAQRLRLLRNHGGEPRYFHKIVGANVRLDAIQAAVLLVKLKYLDGWHKARQGHAEHHRTLLSKSGVVEHGDVSLPENPDAGAGARTHIHNQVVIRARRRDSLREFLTDQEARSTTPSRSICRTASSIWGTGPAIFRSRSGRPGKPWRCRSTPS
jgi:dTDP-4-amino-4,6-dideoxygalactose transaminase